MVAISVCYWLLELPSRWLPVVMGVTPGIEC